MNRELTERDVDDLERTLLANPADCWANILSDYFGVDFQIVEMIINGYKELGSETMLYLIKKLENNASEGNDGIYYNSYLNGQLIEPTEEDRKEADQALKRAEEHINQMRAQAGA